MGKQVSLMEVPKLVTFAGSEFNSWKRKAQFGMKLLDIFYTVISTVEEQTDEFEAVKWIKDDVFCRDYILNRLSDRLTETYSKMGTAKKIWEALDAQFKKEEELSKTHLVDKFMAHCFKDDQAVLPQVTDLENLVTKLNQEKITICDVFLVGAIIYKLPSRWHSFKTEMYRKKVQIGLDELKRFIRIEDENRARNNLEMVSQQKAAANMIQYPKRNSKPSNFNKSKPSPSEPQKLKVQKNISKKKGKCFNCNKWGHYASECRQPKKEKSDAQKEKINLVDKTESTPFVAMIGKGDTRSTPDWYLDSGATCHVCSNKLALTELCKVSESVMVANGNTAEVTARGTAHLSLSSENGENGGENLDMDLDESDLLDE